MSTPRSQEASSKKKPKRLPLELRMLSAISKNDRDLATKARKRGSSAPPTRTANGSNETHTTPNIPTRHAANLVSGGSAVVPSILAEDSESDDDVPIRTLNGRARAALLNSSGGGDIAANAADDHDGEDDDKENVPFSPPPPPTGKGKNSFEGIDPTNIILPLLGTQGCFEKVMICPNILCCTKNPDDDNYLKPSLTTENVQYGFASEFYISCTLCDWGHCISPTDGLEKGDTPNSSPTKKKSKREAEAFHNYEINYAMAICMQKLGKGFTHLALMMACIGISNSIGSTWKWKRLMNRVGLAYWEVAEEVMEENRKVERDITIAKADEKLLKWLETEATEHDDIEKKRDEYLHKLEGKIGLIMSGDQGWQKKRIGTNGGDSLTSHNFGLGGYSQLPMSCESVSQTCRICDLAVKVGKEPKTN